MTLRNTLSDIISDGLRILDGEQYRSRLAVCGHCEKSKTDAFGISCGLCGCNMHLKAKFIASRCPANLWDQTDISNIP